MKKLKFTFFTMILFSIVLISCEKDAPNPVASFILDKTSSQIGETIYFVNTSENASNYFWDFGDGNTSTDENPTYSYSSDGTFTITLTATGEGGEKSVSKTIEIITDLIGVWHKTFEIGTESFEGVLDITQNSENSLSGSFVFSDGSGSTSILPSSNISDNIVTIEWWLGSSYKLTFIGAVNSTFNYMGGSFYDGNGYEFGDWSATKTATKTAIKKSVLTKKNHSDSDMQQQLMDFLEKVK